MARIRSIKPEFWTSEQVMMCSFLTRLFFIGLWNFCDDAGRHPASPKQLKALIFPCDEIPLETIQKMILELSENGLIQVYLSAGRDFLQVTGWNHQKIDRPQPAKYPAPAPVPAALVNPFDEYSTNVRDGRDRIGRDRKKDPYQEVGIYQDRDTLRSARAEAEPLAENVTLLRAPR